MKTYEDVIDECRKIFDKKTQDYGTSWRVMRLSSLTDQIMIKVRRIQILQTIEDKQQVADTIESDLFGAINYSIIALIQMRCSNTTPLNLRPEEAMKFFDDVIADLKILYSKKNHDYGNSWEILRQTSIIDLILMKIFRLINIENNKGRLMASENIDTIYEDVINYSIFAIILGEDK
ncbi:MAG: DUF1599 domain-containing protein [Cytophagales bacterium]|jgi:hypothetical protein|nr:DUF1599 domain-containing protein [Cytophagales bacterium]